MRAAEQWFARNHSLTQPIKISFIRIESEGEVQAVGWQHAEATLPDHCQLTAPFFSDNVTLAAQKSFISVFHWNSVVCGIHISEKWFHKSQCRDTSSENVNFSNVRADSPSDSRRTRRRSKRCQSLAPRAVNEPKLPNPWTRLRLTAGMSRRPSATVQTCSVWHLLVRFKYRANLSTERYVHCGRTIFILCKGKKIEKRKIVGSEI